MKKSVPLRAFAVTFAVCLGSWSVSAQETEGDPRLAEWVNALASPDGGVRARAGRELLARGREGIRALLDAAAGRNVIIAEEARQILTSAGPEAIDTIREVGYYKAFDHRERLEEALTAVARMGQPVLPRMLETLTTGDPVGSRFGFAVGVLLRMRGPAVEPMIRLLKHPNPKVRYEATVLLAQWGDSRAFDGLLEALQDEDSNVRAYAADGLGNIGDHRAVEALLGQLNDPKGEPRRAAIAALGRMYEPRLLHPIARLARGDGDILVRETASNVLMERSRDRVGIRVGKRYRPYALSPADRPWIQLGFALRFALTAAVLLGLALWLPRRIAKGVAPLWLPVALALGAAATAGFLWGRVVDHIWGAVEDMLLFGVVPATAAFGYALLPVRESARRAVGAWLTTIAGFYLGYGVGWVVLWGYLGI
jgi:hypothetical protein